MEQTVEFSPFGFKLAAKAGDLVVRLDVAAEDLLVGEKFRRAGANLPVSYDQENFRPLAEENLGHGAGDALFVRHAEDQEPLSRQL